MAIYRNTGNLTSDYTTEERKKKEKKIQLFTVNHHWGKKNSPHQQLLTVSTCSCFHDGVLSVDRLHLIQNHSCQADVIYLNKITSTKL